VAFGVEIAAQLRLGGDFGLRLRHVDRLALARQVGRRLDRLQVVERVDARPSLRCAKGCAFLSFALLDLLDGAIAVGELAIELLAAMTASVSLCGR
jgi:hypothetical protein